MHEIKEQYEEELKNQEIKANRHTMRCFLWFLVVAGIIWILTVIGFFEVDKKLITIAFFSTAVLFLPVLIIRLRSDLSKKWIKYFLAALICIVTALIVTFLSYHAVLLYVVPLLIAIQYRRRDMIWYVFAVNTVTMIISSLASFYFGICDLNLLLQSQHVRAWYMEIITDNALNIPFNENPVFIILVFEVLPRSMILFVFSVMMQYTIVSSKEDALKIAQLTYMKEVDRVTRVFNKNKYEEMVESYYPEIDEIAVVFWDLNNLKYINDTYGHAVGDKIITNFSTILNRYSSDRCRIYRFGGDEFVVIIDNPKQDVAEKLISDVKKQISDIVIDNTIMASGSAGYAYGKGKDITEVVKRADSEMYEDKKRSKEGRAK